MNTNTQEGLLALSDEQIVQDGRVFAANCEYQNGRCVRMDFTPHRLVAFVRAALATHRARQDAATSERDAKDAALTLAAQAAPAVPGMPAELKEAIEKLSMLPSFLAGWRLSEGCKNNQMEAQVDQWKEGLRTLFRVYDDWGHEPEDAAPTPAAQTQAPAPAHGDDVAVDEFAAAMKAKLADARAKGRHGWQTYSQADLTDMLHEHVAKGDPRDVANFCMFLWKLGHGIKPVSGYSYTESMAYAEGFRRGYAQAPAVGDEPERDRLRAAQTAAVMPLIGPLLDAWEQADREVMADEPELARWLKAINTAMETAGESQP